MTGATGTVHGRGVRDWTSVEQQQQQLEHVRARRYVGHSLLDRDSHRRQLSRQATRLAEGRDQPHSGQGQRRGRDQEGWSCHYHRDSRRSEPAR